MFWYSEIKFLESLENKELAVEDFFPKYILDIVAEKERLRLMKDKVIYNKRQILRCLMSFSGQYSATNWEEWEDSAAGSNNEDVYNIFRGWIGAKDSGWDQSTLSFLYRLDHVMAKQ